MTSPRFARSRYAVLRCAWQRNVRCNATQSTARLGRASQSTASDIAALGAASHRPASLRDALHRIVLRSPALSMAAHRTASQRTALLRNVRRLALRGFVPQRGATPCIAPLPEGTL